MNKSLNLMGYFAPSGYGIATANIAINLIDKCNLYLHPIGNTVNCDISHQDKILKYCAEKYDGKAPCLKIAGANMLKEQIGSAKHIGFPFFELDRFNNYEKGQLQQLDHILVASNWARNILIENKISPDKISVVPLGVDREVFYESNDSPKESDPLRFFCCGKWEIRKGHDIVIKAFNKAFSPNDNVELVMNCNNPFLDSAEIARWENMYLKSKMGAKVRIIKERIPDITSLAKFMRRMDVGIFCSRAEGWNLELLEMLSCGKQCIATNVTAHTEFINNENCRLIECSEIEEAFDSKWFFGQGNWANIGESQIEAIASNMRDFYKEKQATGSISLNTAGVNTTKQLTWANSAERIINVI